MDSEFKPEEIKPAEIQLDEYESQPRKLQPRMEFSIGIIAIALSLFQLYTSWRGSFDIYIQRPVHIAFVFTILFFLFPITHRSVKRD